MIENDVCCVDVLVQVAAVKAAINNRNFNFEHHAKECFAKSLEAKSQEDVIQELMKVLTGFYPMTNLHNDSTIDDFAGAYGV